MTKSTKSPKAQVIDFVSRAEKSTNMNAKIFTTLVDVKVQLQGVTSEMQNVNTKVNVLTDEIKDLREALYNPDHGVYVQLHDAATKTEIENLTKEKNSLASKVKSLLLWRKRVLWFIGVTFTTLLTAGAKPMWTFIISHIKFVN